jgi:hypothetical protein
MRCTVLIAPGLQDGKSIITGWSDGRVRAFGPQSGKLVYTINDAHHKAVTALAATPDAGRIISGGEEGGLAGTDAIERRAHQQRACRAVAGTDLSAKSDAGQPVIDQLVVPANCCPSTAGQAVFSSSPLCSLRTPAIPLKTRRPVLACRRARGRVRALTQAWCACGAWPRALRRWKPP